MGIGDYDFIPDNKFIARSTIKPDVEQPKKRTPTIIDSTTPIREITTQLQTEKSTHATESFQYDPRKGTELNIQQKTKTQEEKEFVEKLMNQHKLEGVEIYEVTSKKPIKLQMEDIS